jgi:hypothetical protein
MPQSQYKIKVIKIYEVLGCNKKITTIKVPIDNALEVISLFVEN